MAVFHQRLSDIKDCLPSMVVFHPRLPSIKDCLPSKFVFHQRLSFIISRLPSLVVFQPWENWIWYCPFCIKFEIFHYKTDTCANKPAHSLSAYHCNVNTVCVVCVYTCTADLLWLYNCLVVCQGSHHRLYSLVDRQIERYTAAFIEVAPQLKNWFKIQWNKDTLEMFHFSRSLLL